MPLTASGCWGLTRCPGALWGPFASLGGPALKPGSCLCPCLQGARRGGGGWGTSRLDRRSVGAWEPEDIQAAGLARAKAGRWEAGGTFGDRENSGMRPHGPGEWGREGHSQASSFAACRPERKQPEWGLCRWVQAGGRAPCLYSKAEGRKKFAHRTPPMGLHRGWLCRNHNQMWPLLGPDAAGSGIGDCSPTFPTG